MRKKMSKALIIGAMLSLGLVGCSNNGNEAPTQTPTQTEQPVVSQEPTQEPAKDTNEITYDDIVALLGKTGDEVKKIYSDTMENEDVNGKLSGITLNTMYENHPIMIEGVYGEEQDTGVIQMISMFFLESVKVDEIKESLVKKLGESKEIPIDSQFEFAQYSWEENGVEVNLSGDDEVLGFSVSKSNQ